MEVLVPVILGMKSKLTFSSKFSLECRGAKASISLERKSRLASCVTSALGTLVTSVLKKKTLLCALALENT